MGEAEVEPGDEFQPRNQAATLIRSPLRQPRLQSWSYALDESIYDLFIQGTTGVR